jgi:hypothetical protein
MVDQRLRQQALMLMLKQKPLRLKFNQRDDSQPV